MKQMVRHLFLITFLMATFSAQARLLISPYHVVFDEKTRSEVVTLLNTTTKTMTYTINFTEMLQTKNGGYTARADDMNAYIASPMLRYSPKRVTIPAGGKQRVRIHFKPKPDLADGSYRSHLVMKVKPAKTEIVDDQREGIGLKVDVHMSFSIPVVVNVGEPAAEVAITKARIVPTKDGKQAVSVELMRKGVYGSYGSLYVYAQASPGAPIEVIGEANNITVFRERNDRTAQVPLFSKVKPGTVIKVVYMGKDEYEGHTFAEKVFKAG
ncbi:MAG: hypothetical protein K6L73_12370 [Cellvibrionaceae bacterium]